jgi:predicted ATPase
VTGLPTGTVTFLFTDIEGSTRLLDELGREDYALALAEHRRIVREAVVRHGGTEVDTQGDAFFVAFPTASSAIAAAGDVRAELAEGPVRVRMGIHSGEPLQTGEGYVGLAVHRAARIAAAGHGGQVLVTEATRQLLDDPTDLQDLGLVRLKDLAAPQRVYQLGSERHPRLHTLDRTNLPVPATEFLGRREELEALAVLLRDPARRLLTLVGPGGTGKTRLGLQAAAEAVDAFPGGVTWVALAPVRDTALVLPTVAASLGVRPDGRDVVDALAASAPPERALLLLDNLEQVIDAAAEISVLLARCPTVTVLGTSREPLLVDGEHVVHVPSLDRDEAVALFDARARAVGSEGEAGPPVERLCERLDDLPLAIELAAARLRALSVDALLERLGEALDLLQGRRDADPRHQTLRATIAWSHDLLDERERTLFRRFGVFAGDCSLDAVEAICDADLDAITSLLDKSLLRRRIVDGEDRYWMLETVRRFAVEQLAESGEEAATADRHAEWFARLAAELGEHALATMGWGTAAIGRELVELRAAFAWLAATEQYELLAEAAAAAAPHWYFVIDPGECVQWLEECLAQPLRGEAPGRVEASLAMLLLYSDTARALELAVHSLTRLQAPAWRALAWTTLGNARVAVDAAAASDAYEHAVRIAAEHGLDRWTTGLRSNMSLAAASSGDWEAAAELAGRVLEGDDPLAKITAYGTLALKSGREGVYETARAELACGLRLAGEHAPLWLGSFTRLAAWIDALEGRLERAAVLHGAYESDLRLRGWEAEASDLWESARPLLEERLEAGELERALELGASLSIAEAAAIVLGEREPPAPAE